MGQFFRFKNVDRASKEVVESEGDPVSVPISQIRGRARLGAIDSLDEPWCREIQPEVVENYEQDLADNEVVAYVEIFLDSFSSTTSTNQSRTGLYFRLLNFKSAVRGINGVTCALSCWPSDGNQREALSSLRNEMAELERTGPVEYRCPIENRKKKIHIVIAALPADLMQIYSNCRHGGNASNMNCPNCWTTKHDRLDIRDLRDHELIRTDTFTDHIIAYVVGKQLSPHKTRQLLRSYGIHGSDPSPFEGCGVDTHQQSFRDYQHLFLQVCEGNFE